MPGIAPVPAAEQVHVMCQGGFAGPGDWWRRPAEQWGPGEALLACAATAIAELRAAVQAELGYSTSAGVAHTKLLAKLCSG
jgi:DNA polymerase eta